MAVAESTVEPEASGKRLGVFHQLFRFVVIGGGCAVIDAGTYSLMLALGWPIWLSRAISFILGTSTSYLLNRKLTFHGANTGNTTAKAGAFALVYIVTFFVNWGTNQLLTTLTHAQGNSLLLGICWVVGQGLGTLINFVMLKWVVFRE